MSQPTPNPPDPTWVGVIEQNLARALVRYAVVMCHSSPGPSADSRFYHGRTLITTEARLEGAAIGNYATFARAVRWVIEESDAPRDVVEAARTLDDFAALDAALGHSLAMARRWGPVTPPKAGKR